MGDAGGARRSNQRCRTCRPAITPLLSLALVKCTCGRSPPFLSPPRDSYIILRAPTCLLYPRDRANFGPNAVALCAVCAVRCTLFFCAAAFCRPGPAVCPTLFRLFPICVLCFRVLCLQLWLDCSSKLQKRKFTSSPSHPFTGSNRQELLPPLARSSGWLVWWLSG